MKEDSLRSLPPASRAQAGSQPAHSRPWLLPLIAGFGVLSVAATLAFVILILLLIALPTGRVAAGVQVAGIDLAGLTQDAASAQITAHFASATVDLTDGDRRWTLPIAELGITPDSAYLAAQAAAASPGSDIQPQFVIDLDQTQRALIGVADTVYIEPTTDSAGRALEIPALLDALRLDPISPVQTGLTALPIIELPPVVSAPPVSTYTGTTSTHIVEAGEELGLIARLYNVTSADIASMNGIADPNLIYPGQELIIPAPGIYQPVAVEAPPAATTNGRSIVVSVNQQRIYAYENGQLVHSQLVSTGLPDTPTVLGDYAVYVKYVATDMSGPGYFLPGVPYTMYFYRGYGIHGTYWHNNFGRPMSHGCVNLPVDQAAWFFDFASVGTPVRVIA